MARFGRTDWADFSFPDDSAMAEVHFSVECGEAGVVLRPLSDSAPTLVNGKPAQETVLRPGDRVTAGRTSWVVELEDVPESVASPAEAAASAQNPTQSAQEWIALLSHLEVADEALAVPQDGQTADEVVAGLIAAEQFAAAAQLRAHQLQPRASVWWGYDVVTQSGLERLPPKQIAALQAVRAWVATPAEPQRRACEQQAAALSYQGPGGFLAASAFFSGDNIAPADCPTPTPPDSRLTGRLITALLVIAVAQTQGVPPAAAWQRVLDKAAQLLSGPIDWPAAAPAAG